MDFIVKQQSDTITKYKLFGKLTLYKKEIFISSKTYFLLGFMFKKTYIKPDNIKTYFLGIKVKDKKIDIISKIRQYTKNKDFIYYCFHTGDFYYLIQILKNQKDKFNNTVIITNFKELKQVLYLFDFDKKWIDEHFIVVPELFYFSLALYCDKNGKVLSKMELDHEKGWIVNGILQKEKRSYFPINKVIHNFLQYSGSLAFPISSFENYSSTSTVMILPESQFNGNIPVNELKKIVKELVLMGYHILLNTKSNVYDECLNENVKKIFLSYKETYNIACSCKAIIGIRSGLYDCLQNVANYGVKCFVIFQNKKYPHYKFFKNFLDWFLSVYSFNNINNTKYFKEFCIIDVADIIKIVQEIKRSENA